MTMSLANHFDHKAWLKSRTLTFYIFLIETCALGMEYSLTFITLWSYLKDVVQTENLKFFYSAISCVYLLSQVSMSLIFSRIFDWNRNTRVMISAGNALIVTGNLLYTIPWSPWYLFCGRLISGGGGCVRSIVTAEVARAYPEDELSKKYSFLGMSVALGFVLGPLLNIPFANAKFNLFGVPITYANAPGLVLGVTFVLIQILVCVGVSNLSKEYDMKLEQQGDGFIPLMSIMAEDIEDDVIISLVGNDAESIPSKMTMLLTTETLKDEESEKVDIDVIKNIQRDHDSETVDIDVIKNIQRDHDSETVDIEVIKSIREKRNSTISPARSCNMEKMAKISENKKITNQDNVKIEQSEIENLSLMGTEDEAVAEAVLTKSRNTEMALKKIMMMRKEDMTLRYHDHKPLIKNDADEADDPDDPDDDRIENCVDDVNQWRVFLCMMKDPVMVLLLVLSLFFMYTMVIFDIWLPMAATEFLGYGVTQINYIVLGFGLFSVAQFVLLSVYPIATKKLVHLAVLCIVAQSSVFGIFLLLKDLHGSDSTNIALFAVWDLMSSMVITVEEIFLITMVAMKVTSQYQATCESIRLAFSRFGAVLALSTATTAFSNMYLTVAIAVGLLLVSLLILVLKKKAILKGDKVVIN